MNDENDGGTYDELVQCGICKLDSHGSRDRRCSGPSKPGSRMMCAHSHTGNDHDEVSPPLVVLQ